MATAPSWASKGSIHLSPFARQVVGQAQVVEGSSGFPYPLPSSARRMSVGVVSMRSCRVRLGRHIEIRKKAIPRNTRRNNIGQSFPFVDFGVKVGSDSSAFGSDAQAVEVIFFILLPQKVRVWYKSGTNRIAQHHPTSTYINKRFRG